MQSKSFGKHLRALLTTTSCARGRWGRGGWDGLRSVWVGTDENKCREGSGLGRGEPGVRACVRGP